MSETVETNDYPEPTWPEATEEEIEEAIREWAKDNRGIVETGEEEEV